ncbi:hypothetical protein Pcinc_025287 [Petrolisthes cinctipes]|uniref:Uncharacterized protein n=1 Tax=Petrolisthes cinctipes TaxID=88211 RepID=A0AAE1F917_PETCI|nr:hypothetical protein Pcinc_025287 [Petrolisthes cinctipes]
MSGRRSRKDLAVLRSRSLSPNVPYLYPDSTNESLENKYRKGWYRVDYGGTQEPQMWFLPRFSDRLKFLEYHVDRKMAEPRASSVPPMAENTVRTVARYTKPTTTTVGLPSYHYRSLYYPYRNWNTYSPIVGPYSGRLWSSLYSWPYSYSHYWDSPSLDTKLLLDKADRVLNRTSWIPHYYRGYNRYLPSSYYDYDYYYPSLRTSSYLDDDYLSYRYRPRIYDHSYRASSVPRTTTTYSYSYDRPRPITTTRTYYAW